MAKNGKKPKKPLSGIERFKRNRALLEEHGPGYWLSKRRLDPCTLAKEIEEHLHATSVKVFHHQGEVVYSEPMRDWAAQFRALDLAVRLWGMMPKEKIELTMPESLVNRIIEARKRATVGTDT